MQFTGRDLARVTSYMARMENVTATKVKAFEDNDLIREAAALTREFSVAKPGIYWPDFLGSALVGYIGL